MTEKKTETKTETKIEDSFTKYEAARIIGARALQISLGAPVLVKVPKELRDSVRIAKYEFEQGATPMTVRRLLPERME